MSFNPLVTVGIPAYNAEKYIKWAIQSVLNQTFKDFELIITDDGSSDHTVEIARSFNDPRITVLSDGENHGISYRLNQQIEFSKGKYFARMDADDIMLPDRLQKQFDYMESHPDIDCIGGSAIVIDENNEIIGQRGMVKASYELNKINCVKRKTFIHPTVFGRMDFFLKYMYSNEYKGVEDINLWLTSCIDSKLIYIPETVLFYRDPLKFKLRTYLSRQKRYRQLWSSNKIRRLYGNNVSYRRVVSSLIRTILAFILTLLRKDSLMIKRRNKKCENAEKVKQILQNCI